MFKQLPNSVTFLLGNVFVLVGIILTFWLNEEFNKPRIEYYSRPYYKIGNSAIGNVYLYNAGRKPDKNIAVTLFTNIDPKDLKVVDYTSNYQIKNIDNKTTIILDELKPQEGADITFNADPNEDDTEMDIVSYSSRISNGYEEKWWHFPLIMQVLIVVVAITTGFMLGLLVHKLYSRAANKKQLN